MNDIHVRVAAAALSLLALSGCGGGGGTEGTIGDIVVGPGNNGLPGAVEGLTLSGDATGIEFDAASARSSAAGQQLVTIPVTFGADFFRYSVLDGPGALDADIVVNGQPVTITNGVGSYGGSEAVLTYDPDTMGEYSAIFGVTVPEQGIQQAYAVGFETDPSVLATISRAVLYEGGFSAQGTSRRSGDVQEAELDGSVAFLVDFDGADRISADLEGTWTHGAGGTSLTLYLKLDPRALDGNEFSGALLCADRSCSGSSSRISGTFYGPMANELAGVMAIDATVSGYTFEGAGNFLITDPVAQ